MFVKGGIGPNKLVVGVEKDLHGAAGGEHLVVVGVEDGVMKDDFGCVGRLVFDGDGGRHAIDDGAAVVYFDIDQGGIVASIADGEVVEPISAAKAFARVFEIEQVIAMPYQMHGIDFAKTYCKGLCMGHIN